MISGFTIGPRTVLELHSTPYLYGEKKIICNESYSEDKFVDIGCEPTKKEYCKWLNNILSFRIWDYNYWVMIMNPRYCNKDTDCNQDEYCLCPGGQEFGEWCPYSKKRCLHKSHYLQSKRKTLHISDLIDTSCLKTQIKDTNKRYLRASNIKGLSERCYGPELTYDDGIEIEGFSNDIISFYANYVGQILITIFIIFLILFIREKIEKNNIK